MAISTYGTMGVDWEQRIDFDRLRTQRLDRIKKVLAQSEAGSLLLFDMNNVRYVTSTHIGTWAQDKVARYTLLAQGSEPILWDFGSAARHHQLYAPWLDGAKRSRPGVSMLRGTISPEMGRAEKVAGDILKELTERGLHNDPVAIDLVELPILFALQAVGLKVIDGQQLMLEARKIKTVDEISLLTHAAGMVDGAYQLVYENLRPGVRENDIVGLVTKFLYEHGSEMVEGVNAISGERCNPHPHVASDRMLRPGDPAYFDILQSYMGYRTCYYRTFVVGSASRAQVSAYDKCRDLLDHAISLIKPGVTTAEVVEIWPRAQDFGFPDEELAFALQYGHGIGLNIWEKPIFSRLVSFDHPEVIEEGMVFALETFWPAADGWSAARIEEEVVVTKHGCEIISRFPAEQLMVTGPRYYSTAGPLPAVRETQSALNNPRVNPAGLPQGDGGAKISAMTASEPATD